MVDPIDTSTLGPIRVVPPRPDDWRAPYRSMDASGGPDTALGVAWAWIDQCADDAKAIHGGVGLHIQGCGGSGSLGAIVLYLDTNPIAVATVFRDGMNFAVLIRWKAEGVA